MPVVNYAEEIKEDLKTIVKVENTLKYVLPRRIIQLIKVLKSGRCNLKQAAKLLNISYRTARRHWNFYKKNGIEGIKNWKPPTRTTPKLSDKQLLEIFTKYQPRTLKEATIIIKEKTGVKYTISGLYSRIIKLKIKLKTGRPSHIKKIQ